jgi:hypothetical protein
MLQGEMGFFSCSAPEGANGQYHMSEVFVHWLLHLFTHYLGY